MKAMNTNEGRKAQELAIEAAITQAAWFSRLTASLRAELRGYVVVDTTYIVSCFLGVKPELAGKVEVCTSSNTGMPLWVLVSVSPVGGCVGDVRVVKLGHRRRWETVYHNLDVRTVSKRIVKRIRGSNLTEQDLESIALRIRNIKTCVARQREIRKMLPGLKRSSPNFDERRFFRACNA